MIENIQFEVAKNTDIEGVLALQRPLFGIQYDRRGKSFRICNDSFFC